MNIRSIIFSFVCITVTTTAFFSQKVLANTLYNNILNPDATTVLEQGDVAILRVEGNGATDFSFVTFVDILPGTEIYFTDCGAYGKGLALPCAEGAVLYTVPEKGLKVGEIVHFIDNENFSTYRDGGITGSFEMNVGGDQVLVFQDENPHNDIDPSAEPYFIHAVNLASRFFDSNANPFDVNQTQLPFLLYDTSNPRTALGLGRGNGKEDAWVNTVYEGPYKFQTLEDAIQHINYALNFHGDDHAQSETFTTLKAAMPQKLTIGFPLRITEIMPNPKAVSDSQGEYFEIFNKEDDPIDIEGWTISDTNGESHTIANAGQGVVVPPNGFLVLGNNADQNNNGGVAVDYEYKNISLSNYFDDIILTDALGEEQDRVEYDLLRSAVWPYRPNGQALVFIGTENEDNNFGGLWSLAAGSQGITTDLGSPGHNGSEQYLSEEVVNNMVTFDKGSWTDAPDGDSHNKFAVVVSGTPVLEGDIHLAGLQVRHGAAVEVKGVLHIDKSLIIKGDLTFKADANGCGELAAMPDDVVCYGEVTVEQYFGASQAYHWVTSPVNTGRGTIFDNWQEKGRVQTGLGTHITGGRGSWGSITAKGFDATPNGSPSMYAIDETSQRLSPIANTNTTALKAGDSYLMYMKGDRTIDLTKDQDPTATLLRTKGTLAAGSLARQIPALGGTDNDATAKTTLLFGNPYMATLDMNKVLNTAQNQNINTNFYYVFDPTLGAGDFKGGYVAVATHSGQNATGYAGGNFLAPGQAFKVELLDDSVASQLVFEENQKAPGQFGKSQEKDPQQPDIKTLSATLYYKDAFNGGGRPQDGMVINFAKGFDNDRTPADAGKLFNLNENLASNTPHGLLAIDNRNLPEVGDRLPLYTVNYTAEAYVLQLELPSFDGVQPVLYDAYLDERINLEAGANAYDFNITDDYLSRSPDRFSLVFEANLDVNEHTLAGTQVFPNPWSGEALTFSAPELQGESLHLKMVDMQGRTVYDKKQVLSAPVLRMEMARSLSAGLYTLYVEAASGSMVHKIIKN